MITGQGFFVLFTVLFALGLVGLGGAGVALGIYYAVISFRRRDLSGFLGLAVVFVGVLLLVLAGWFYLSVTSPAEALAAGCYRLHFETQSAGKSHAQVPVYDPIGCAK